MSFSEIYKNLQEVLNTAKAPKNAKAGTKWNGLVYTEIEVSRNGHTFKQLRWMSPEDAAAAQQKTHLDKAGLGPDGKPKPVAEKPQPGMTADGQPDPNAPPPLPGEAGHPDVIDAAPEIELDKDGFPKGTPPEDIEMYNEIHGRMDKNLERKTDPIGDYKGLSGHAGENAKGIFNNMTVHMSQYRDYMTEDKEALFNHLTNGVTDLLHNYPEQFSHIDAKDMDSLMRDSIDKIIHQESESAKVTYTDHGCRHILGNIGMSDHMLSTLTNNGWPVTPMDRFMAIVTHVNHDMGYGEKEVRGDASKGKQHIENGAKLWNCEKGKWNAGKIFDEPQFDRMSRLIGNHQYGANRGGEDLGFNKVDSADHVEIAVRLADNLAMFHKEKTPALFEYVPDAKEKLIEMGKATKDDDKEKFATLKKSFIKDVKGLKTLTDGKKVSKQLRKDLLEAADKINPLTPKFTMGVMAGAVEKIDSDDDAELVIHIKHNEFDEHLQKVFDMGQQKVRGLLKDYGQIEKDYDGPIKDTEYRFGTPHPDSGKKQLIKFVIDNPPKGKKDESLRYVHYNVNPKQYKDSLMEMVQDIEETLNSREQKISDKLKIMNKKQLIAILKKNDRNGYNLDSLYDTFDEKELRNYILTFRLMGGDKFCLDCVEK